MAIPVLRLFFSRKTLPQIKKRLRKIKLDLTKGFSKPRRSIVTQLLKMADAKFVQSARGTLPRGWDPMSAITGFIRAHRAKGGRTKDPALGVDTSVMRASTRPFAKGELFGIENKLSRAERFNFGGRTSGGTVKIAGFKRISKLKKEHRVRPYTMTLGSHRQPSRPFFPVEREYISVVRRILKDFEKKVAKGTA